MKMCTKLFTYPAINSLPWGYEKWLSSYRPKPGYETYRGRISVRQVIYLTGDQPYRGCENVYQGSTSPGINPTVGS